METQLGREPTPRVAATVLVADASLAEAEGIQPLGYVKAYAYAARVAEVASEHDVPSAQVALAWLLGKPGVTAPIIGATKPSHLADALAAEELTLTDDDVARLEEPYVPHPVLGHF